MHKNSGCSITTFIFFKKTLAFFSAMLMQDLTALAAFTGLTILLLWMPSDLTNDDDKISEVSSLLILKIRHFMLILPSSIIPIELLESITLLLSYHGSVNQLYYSF